MVTVYCTARELLRFEESASCMEQSNIVDLNRYRRQRAQSVCTVPEEDPEGQQAEEPEVLRMPGSAAGTERPERERRRDRRAWMLDLWASLGVVVMTAAFTLRVILG